MRTLCVISVLAVCTLSQAADPREVEVRKAQDAFGHCWNAHAKDTSCMDKLLTADFTAVTLGARPETRTSFIEWVQTLPDSNTWDTPPDARIQFYGATAIVSYGVAHDKPVDHVDQFTHVWVNENAKGWRMARLHASQPRLAAPGRK